ncbi:response regulator [Lichenifustis flavocetrariae]|uniref:Response regulator n=1 Tax=Lichenifustis flavocetrariae TaxID=2949735 RepID=A0AA41ZBY0_9HYPH|nr:response regulator [Lichenifustis flavocetrariae]MCW6513062.1 response regulator [Lichenifustis flavocetrariae]
MGIKQVVVVIEDDVLLRLQAAELFDLAGMTVQTYATGEDAIEFVQKHEAEVACIFTDLKLGGGADGLQVVRAVSSALPKIPVVLTSGELPERPEDLPANVKFVAKPWQPFDVINAVQDAKLDDSREVLSGRTQ